jgi:ubiquinone biosynthesis protein
VLAATCALAGVVLVTSEAGPMMTATLPLYTFLGFVLLLFGFVLGARAVVLVFRHRTPDAIG